MALLAGSLSGALQFFASKYAPWLVREGRTSKVTNSTLRKIMPFLSDITASKIALKLSTLTKYTVLELLFVMVPVSIFFLSDSYSSVLDSAKWLTNIVGHGFDKFTYDFVLWKFAVTVGASTYSQFPWDEAISKLNSIDLEQNQNDPSHAAWIRFRTNGYFLGISALSVLAMAVSFGNVVAGYTIMAILGSLGIYIGNRAVKKAQFLKATAEDFTIIPGELDTTFHVKVPNIRNKIVNCESYLVKTGS